MCASGGDDRKRLVNMIRDQYCQHNEETRVSSEFEEKRREEEKENEGEEKLINELFASIQVSV